MGATRTPEAGKDTSCWKCQGKGLIPPKMKTEAHKSKKSKFTGAGLHNLYHDFVTCDVCGGNGKI